MKTHLIPAALAALVALAAIPAHAATLSASPTAPVIDGEDIANYSAVSGTDKWWVASGTDSNTKGQSFTTGDSAVRIKAITYQVEGTSATATKTYLIRLGRVTGTVFTQIHSETAVQSAPWNSNESMTWTFDTPVLLQPHTTYGIDVTMVSSTTGWQTGIPYITVSGDDYSGGMKYSSTTSAGGTTSISNAIASDRIFHLDIERPLGPVFELVAPSPADDASDALATSELILTFSQNVTPGSGNLTIRNLTDSSDVALPAGDPRLTYDQNVVRVDPAGLLDWNKSYAIRLDSGVFLGDASAPIAAITDDTTWNFTTLPGDPLLAAIAAIKNHVTGAATLTGPQIAAHKTTIDDLRQRFAESTATISAVFDLITTYETAKGPLFVSGSTVTSFDRNNTTPTSKNSVSPENYHWVVYTVMQHAMDVIYNAPELAEYEALLTGYKFGSHTNFPGPCSPPADPLNVHAVDINGSFPVTFGRNTQQWTAPARKPTGTYLSPGTIATVTVPPALVNAGYKVRVGAHSWDLSGRAPVKRLERATRLYPIDATTIKVASPYGGGIYIEVPIGANAGVVNVSVTGAVLAPYFSAKSFHQTTPAEWEVERTHPAPWADFQSEKFMTQVPRKWIYNMTGAQAVQMMADWDAAMDAIDSLMGFDLTRGKETMYCQPDVILRSSVHAPGYPAVNISTNPNSEVNPLGYAGSYLVRGPNVSLTASNIEFHEQGHAYGFPKFGGESESNVNLLQPAMLNRAFGRTFDEAQNGSFGGGNSNITVDNTAVAWMCVFNFSPREVPMATAEKAYQHKGHAKFMDVARLFGWDKLDAYWRSFMEDDANNIPYGTSDDDNLLRLSRHVGKDIRPLFHFWGIHPQNPTALAAAIAAENIPSSIEIRNQLLHYKTLVPADNAAFRIFAQAWRGKVPSIGGNWEEREHARQWDTTALYGVGDQQRSEATNPGEIYNENSALDITNRVQELVDLYFPSAITPNPMTFAIAPSAVDATTIGMVASTASAAIGPIEYYFDETSGSPGGTDSGWQTSPSYQDTGLSSGFTYSYTVTARDGLANATDPSATASVPLTVAGDITAPSPDPMTFATPPYATDETTITMTATTATDINSVEYEFENTVGGGSSSGWQSSPTFIDGELSPSTEYGYRVRARDSAGNVTGWSNVALTNTADIPDVTPPQIVSLTPSNGTDVTDLASNLAVTFDEPVIPKTGSITLKNLTDGSQTQINVNDTAVSVAGSVMTINPAADLLFGKTYAVRMDANTVADASNNPSVGINDDTTWSFDVILEDPLADAGGPYEVVVGGLLSLDGGASLPSDGETITSYEWDLDNDGNFTDATGATPPAIDFATLTGPYGMTGGSNTIHLRVTDSAGKIATASTTVTLFDTTTFIGTNKTNGDNWNVSGNWDTGIPSGAVNVVIPASKEVTADGGTAVPYNGDLTIGNNGRLQIGYVNTRNVEDFNALGTPGATTIHLNDGALLLFRAGSWGTVTIPAIALEGDANLTLSTSTEPVSNFAFPHGINGPHTLTMKGKSGQDALLTGSNTFNELIITSTEGSYDVFAKVVGSLGGNVTLDAGTGPTLTIDAADAISDTAVLSLNGSVNSTLITMNAADTVGQLKVNGFSYPAGTYGRVGSPGAPVHEVAWIAGDSVLTVTSDTGDLVDPTTVAITNNTVNGEVFLSLQPTVTFTLSFNEPGTFTGGTGDFLSTGTASYNIDSVTQTTDTQIQVAVTASSTGTIALASTGSASFEDLYGNTLNGPFAGATNVTVRDISLIESQLGILNLSANNGVNPATGNLWQAGDTYRLAFVTEGTTLATSVDIADYNAFVQGEAAASTVFTNLGSVTWKAIASAAGDGGSIPAVDARTNTATNTGVNGTGEAIFLMNGTTVFSANYADLWDGQAGSFRIERTQNNILRQGNFPNTPIWSSWTAVWTGTGGSGTASSALGNLSNEGHGLMKAETQFWITRSTADGTTNSLPMYALSVPLTVQTVGSGEPEIVVEQPESTDIPNGGSQDFGPVALGSDTSLVFTIRNTGTADLNLTGTPLVDLTGTNAADFTVMVDPSSPVAAGGNTTFTVRFAPGAAGIRTAMLSITNNDSAKNPFTITVTGTGASPYDTWADGAVFSDDDNGDGIQNGLAWILGAANPSVSALDKLPTVSTPTGYLQLDFTRESPHAPAKLYVEYGNDLSGWTKLEIPAASENIGVGNDIVVTVGAGSPASVQIKIPATHAAGGKLFARLSSTEN